jgi:DNA-binding XRE family transcriptional regulator
MKGEVIKTLRLAAGLNAAQAAEYLGIDRSTLARWEKGGELPRIAAAGAFKLLQPGKELNDWVCSLRSSAREAVKRRIAEFIISTSMVELAGGQYAAGETIGHVTEIGTVNLAEPVPDLGALGVVENAPATREWPASCDKCAGTSADSCAGCPNEKSNPYWHGLPPVARLEMVDPPWEKPDFKNEVEGSFEVQPESAPVSEVDHLRVSLCELVQKSGVEGIVDLAKRSEVSFHTIERFIGHICGLSQDQRSAINGALGNAPDVEPKNEMERNFDGPEVEKLRAALRSRVLGTKKREVWLDGMAQWTGVDLITLNQFIWSNGPLLQSEYERICAAIKEMEGV